MDNSSNHFRDQVMGGVAFEINHDRVRRMAQEFGKVAFAEDQNLSVQNEAYNRAINEVEKIREFLGSPENILGSVKTKHGEIAEVIEVNIRRAKSYLEHNPPDATFDGVGRTAPADYLIRGVAVQSKFVNGLSKNLDHVIKHMEKYQSFGRDGSYYHIPKDHHEALIRILENKGIDGMKDSSLRAIRDKIAQIEERSGQSFNAVVRPGISKYEEVQKGVVHRTVDGHEKKFANQNEQAKKEIRDQADDRRQTIRHENSPSIGEAAKTAGFAALIGGGFSVGMCVYQKHQQGVSISKYDIDDWKDIGVEFTKGGVKGGVSGTAIYGMTNYAGFSAPLASVMVSTTYGVASLTRSYVKGEISADEFSEQGQSLCFDSGAILLGATVGQALIPIPIIGTLIGTFATKSLLSLSRKHLGKETERIRVILEADFKNSMLTASKVHQEVVTQILREHSRLGGLMSMAFSFERNSLFRLDSSIKLALVLGVQEQEILKNTQDVDNYMLS